MTEGLSAWRWWIQLLREIMLDLPRMILVISVQVRHKPWHMHESSALSQLQFEFLPPSEHFVLYDCTPIWLSLTYVTQSVTFQWKPRDLLLDGYRAAGLSTQRTEAFNRCISHFCSRLQMMTMPVESEDASKLSSQLKLTSSTGPPWPCSLFTMALVFRSTSKK